MRDRRSEQAEPLDPVPLTLAVWLGLIAGITGVTQMTENAVANAAATQMAASRSGSAQFPTQSPAQPQDQPSAPRPRAPISVDYSSG